MGTESSKDNDVEDKGEDEGESLVIPRDERDVLNSADSEPESSDESNEDEAISVLDYFRLMGDNPDFLLYTLSFCIAIGSEDMTVIANLTMIEDFQGATKNYLWISAYIVVKQFTSSISALILGGALADSTDRRKSMIKLDIIAAFVALLNFVALHYRSKVGVLGVVFLYQLVAGAYEPCRSAIVPTLFQHSRRDMRMAIVLTITLAYGVMSPLGSAAGGFVVDYLGLRVCFVMNSAAFLLSAVFLSMMKGTYLPRAEEKVEFDPSENLLRRAWRMMKEGIAYSRDKFWRTLVFFRGTTIGFQYGAMEVLYVSYAESLPGSSTLNLAWLYFAVGIGSFLGPLVGGGKQTFYDTQYTGILGSLVIMASIAAIGMSNTLLNTLWSVCVANVFRSCGTRMAGVNARLLLNNFPEDRMLGRVMSLEYVLFVVLAAAGAVVVGVFEDSIGMSATDVTFMFFAANGVVALYWISYQMRDLGGASPEAEHYRNGTVGIATKEKTEVDHEKGENKYGALKEKEEERSSEALLFIWIGIAIVGLLGVYFTILSERTTLAIVATVDEHATTDLIEESSTDHGLTPSEASMPRLSDFGF